MMKAFAQGAIIACGFVLTVLLIVLVFDLSHIAERDRCLSAPTQEARCQ